MNWSELTPEKRARLFANFYPHNDASCRQMSELVANLVTTAVLEERESNAIIAEQCDSEETARLIRART